MNTRYETHKDLLVAACEAAPAGTIVEFGAGDVSTPLLHERYEHRKIITVEHRLEWFLRWAHLTSIWHSFVFCSTPYDAMWCLKLATVLFVDSNPGSERASIVREAHSLNVPIVVAHDTEPDCSPAYAWCDSIQRFKFKCHDNRHKPWTTVMSNTIDVSNLCASIS